MKTQLQKPSAEKSRYEAEFKREALELWRNSGRSAARVAAELGIRAPLLYRWAQQLRLTDENAKLLEQREVLKKSLGILSERPPRSMPKSKP